MPIVLKSGNLNLLEPSGPVQACNGIALPFLLLVLLSVSCHQSSILVDSALTKSEFCSLLMASLNKTLKSVIIDGELPITVAALSKGWVCGRWLAGIAGSNPAGVMAECCVLSGMGPCNGPIIYLESCLVCLSMIVKPR